MITDTLVLVVLVVLIVGMVCLLQIIGELRTIRSMIAKELLRQRFPDADD